MKRNAFLWVAGSLMSMALTASAATRYVNLNHPAPAAPYTSWATAAANIQAAVDAAEVGDDILVTNGVYQTGAQDVYGMSNRVAVTKPVTVRSVNGSAVTSIVGSGPSGSNAVRCVYLTNGAVLAGFTLINGATQTSGDNYRNQSGGGVWCESLGGVVSNCVLTDNSAKNSGGGAYSGTLNNCTLTGNSASYGGGAYRGTLNNCTLTGNSASSGGGGAYSGTLNNCIIYYNSASSGGNYSGGTFNYCCTTPLPAGGTGNIDADPQLASASHLSANSPCLGRGSAVFALGVDLDGEPWANPPAIGCDEHWSGSVTGALSAAIVVSHTNVAVGFEVDFQALIGGRVSASRWDFGDVVVVSNRPWASHAWVAPGDYVVELRAWNESYSDGIAADVTVHVSGPVHYVALASANPVPPYSSWATAATNIQDAIDMAVAGHDILVTNGVYQTGARAVYGMSNRVAVTKPVTVRSVNGPVLTSIVGYQVPGTTNGSAAVRCVYLTNGAVLAGFTLANGATQTSRDAYTNQSGGGIWCEPSAVVSNCVLRGNSAYVFGGGAFDGTLNNCTLSANSAMRGGGANDCMLNNCRLMGNSAYMFGGGAYYSTLNNCTLSGNSVTGPGGSGGGASRGTLNNCTLTGNSAYMFGGGADNCTLKNCIAYYNTASSSGNYFGGTFNYCCTTPLPAGGTGNIDAEPQMASASHLSANSPCIGRGSAAYADGVDLDGEPWANPPAIGCDEYWSGSVTGALSAAILVSYTNVTVGYGVDFQALIGGRVSALRWDFGDGVAVSNRPWASHVWSKSGDYVVELRAYNESYTTGIVANVTVHVSGPVHYVALTSANPVPPYNSWATAAANIQDAVDVATAEHEIVVSNGVYQTGARVVYGMRNRVAVTKSVTVRSVNGPAVTSIVGFGPSGSNAVRCVYLTNGAVLAGFTLINGATQTSGDNYRNQSGGGVWCESSGGVVSNCVLTGNSATNSGGGAYSGTLYNCTLNGNSITGLSGSGGGAFRSTLYNCTLTGNSASNGGGTYDCTLNNCIVYYNTALSSGNYSGGTFNYCCTTPLPAGGTGNIDAEPQLASTSHLSANSPCIGRGSAAYAGGVDRDGEPWASPPAIGCDEYWSGSVTGALSAAILISYTNVTVGYGVDFQAVIGGRASASRWDFGDGVVMSNRPYGSHTWAAVGDYVVELRAFNESYPDGIKARVTVKVADQPMHYVALTSANPVPPYSSWATAATNIQDAVDAVTVPGALVWVTNGVYQAGSRAVYGMSNRVAVTKPVTVRSVNGSAVTSIVGSGPSGSNAVRCVYLTNGAVLAGFTLINGATQISGDNYRNQSGGGVWCESLGGVVSNCVLTDNSAKNSGGGAYNGTLNNCTLTSNSTSGYGGGAYRGTLNNCTLTGNSASSGGGASFGTLNNCIVYYNTAINGRNDFESTLNYCCTTPLPAGGTGNIEAEPQMASASHLSANSPCIGRGSAAYVGGVDLDGEPWANPPTIGCDEYWNGSVTGALSAVILVSYTNVAVGYGVDFQALIGGRVSASRWDFGDGVAVSNRPYASHTWATAGDYVVELRAWNESYSDGIAANVTVHVSGPVHYVALASANPEPPYSSWATAATNIQDAVDVAGVGALVLVANGVYQTGARDVHGMSNRVAVSKLVTVRSVNGPTVTSIVGSGSRAWNAVRCVYLTNGAVLAGFTLTNGATQTSGNVYTNQSGGGVWCESSSAVVSNCVLTGNSASWSDLSKTAFSAEKNSQV